MAAAQESSQEGDVQVGVFKSWHADKISAWLQSLFQKNDPCQDFFENSNLLLKQRKPSSPLWTWVNTFLTTIKDCVEKKEGPAFVIQESSTGRLCIFVGTVISFKEQHKPNTSGNLQSFNVWQSRVMGVLFWDFLWLKDQVNNHTCSSGALSSGRGSEYWRKKCYNNRWENWNNEEFLTWSKSIWLINTGADNLPCPAVCYHIMYEIWCPQVGEKDDQGEPWSHRI